MILHNFLYRMLLQLPTCVVHLEKIIANRSDVEPSPFMLYSSIWGPRCGNKAFTGWLKVSFFNLTPLFEVNNMPLLNKISTLLYCVGCFGKTGHNATS